MRNPAVVGDSEGEWFELHNTGSVDVDLRGWSLADEASDYHVVKRSLIVPAGGYIVLGRTTRNPQNGGVDDRLRIRRRVRAQQQRRQDRRARSVRPVGRRGGVGQGRRLATAERCVDGAHRGRLVHLRAAVRARRSRHTRRSQTTAHRSPIPMSSSPRSTLDPASVSDTTGEWIEITNHSTQTVDLDGWVIRDDDADSALDSAGNGHAARGGRPVDRARPRSVTRRQRRHTGRLLRTTRRSRSRTPRTRSPCSTTIWCGSIASPGPSSGRSRHRSACRRRCVISRPTTPIPPTGARR